MKYQAFATRALHNGYDPIDRAGATSVPIFGAASFEIDTPEQQTDTFAGRCPAHSPPYLHRLTQRAFLYMLCTAWTSRETAAPYSSACYYSTQLFQHDVPCRAGGNTADGIKPTERNPVLKPFGTGFFL
jgi:hypothetical protein